MNRLRYTKLDVEGGRITPQEKTEGWHFCPEWDYMLVGPGMDMELEACICSKGGPANQSLSDKGE